MFPTKVVFDLDGDVDDLKDAIIAKLKLDAPPSRVRLLRETAGRAPVPLDGLKKLAEQGMEAGTSVLIEVMAPVSQPPLHPLLPPLLSMSGDPLLEYQGLVRNAELTAFAHAVCAAQPGPLCAATGTRLWRLYDPADPSQPLKWPYLNAHVLLERDFYARLLTEEKWLGGLSGKQRVLAVLGQPGIGKSSFGLWLLAHLLRSKRTVVYSRNFSKSLAIPDIQHVVFFGGQAFVTATADLGPAGMLLSDPSVVQLCDSIKPSATARCHKVLITSPDPSLWRWFVEREFARAVYFPLHEYAELAALCKAEFGDALSLHTLDLRVLAYGLSARTALSPDQKGVWKSVVRAISELSLEELQRYMSEVREPTRAATSDLPHSLFALQADREELTEGSVTFRSEAVARRVVRQAALRSRDALIPALQRLLASSTTRSVAGTAFELAAIDVLGCSGRRYTARPLFAGGKTSHAVLQGRGQGVPAAQGLTLKPLPAPASSVHCFASLSHLAAQCAAGVLDLRSHYFKPASPNLAAIDFIGPGLQLFQVTVNRGSHELKVTSGRSDGEGLLALYLTLLPLLPERWGALQPHLDVCFVVPEGCAKGWKAQKLVAPPPRASSHVVKTVQCDGGGTGFSVDGRVVQVRQFVMELPLKAIEEWLALPGQQRDVIDEAGES
jgi:hypothetical protein